MAILNYNYTFTPNTAAKATEVNNNFAVVKSFTEGISSGVNIDANAITETKILNGAVSENKLAANAVTAVKLAVASVGNTKLDYTSVPQTTVNTSAPTGGKDGDIWVQVV